MSLHITFRVGNADYAVPAASVLHLETYEGATHVPGSPPYVAGLVHVRGRVVPVVDLRKRFGLPQIERALEHRIVVVQVGTRVTALLVDSAREVVQIDDAAFEPPSDLVDGQSGFITGIASAAKRLLLRIDIPRIIGEDSHG